jgi:hypothetical protein
MGAAFAPVIPFFFLSSLFLAPVSPMGSDSVSKSGSICTGISVSTKTKDESMIPRDVANSARFDFLDW